LKELTRQDICDILDGCVILGTGGGGKAEEGLQMIDRALAGGRKFYLAEIDELEADDLVISPYYCGSTGLAIDKKILKDDGRPFFAEEIERSIG